MVWPFRKILHRTVALVFFASLLPMVLFGLFILTRTRDELSKKAMSVQESLTETVRQGLVSQIAQYGRQLSMFAQGIGMQSMVPSRQEKAIYAFLDTNPLVYSCFVYNASGTITSICYRNRFEGDNRYVGKSIMGSSRRVYRAVGEAFDKVMKTGRITVSDEVVKSHQQTQMLILVPIRSFADSRKIVGVISCGIQVDGPSLQGAIEEFRAGENSFILLTDMNGKVLARNGKCLPEGLRKMVVSRKISQNNLESTKTVLEGKAYILTLGRVPVVNYLVVLGTPEDEVFGFIGQIFLGMLLLTIICLMIGLFFSLLLSDNLVKPVLALIEGVKKVSEGVISHRIDIKGEDELSDACREFNEMAGKLEKNRLLEEMWGKKWNPPR